LNDPPEVLIEGVDGGGWVEGEVEEVGEEGAVGEPTVGVLVGEGVDVGSFLGIGRSEGDIGEWVGDEGMDVGDPLDACWQMRGREIFVIGGHEGW